VSKALHLRCGGAERLVPVVDAWALADTGDGQVEAVERFSFDARWKYAAGGLDFDYLGFVHTVLMEMRARLARSDRPGRIFEVTLVAAKAVGWWVGGGCWIRPRCMTRWPRWTRSP
jgi:hypothetical protein